MLARGGALPIPYKWSSTDPLVPLVLGIMLFLIASSIWEIRLAKY